MKIIVTGAEGQLGSEFKLLSRKNLDHTFVFANRSLLDISDISSLEKFFEINNPDVLINCAAYTAVDKAESEKEQSRKINEEAPGYLGQVCNKHNCILIHYSSDYVYHIGGSKPLTEIDNLKPKGIYAITKLAGEKNVIENCPRSLIIRTSWVYSPFGNNFVKTMLKLGKEREELTIVNDQLGTPTYAHDIATMTLQILPIICKSDFNDFGIYNYSNAGITNWMDFAKKIFELENIKCKVYPTTTKEYGAPAERPLWSVLSKDKIKRVFGLNIPHWEDSLKKCLEVLK